METSVNGDTVNGDTAVESSANEVIGQIHKRARHLQGKECPAQWQQASEGTSVNREKVGLLAAS